MKPTQHNLRTWQYWASPYPRFFLNFLSRPKMTFIYFSLEDKRPRSKANAICCVQVYLHWILLDNEDESIIWILGSLIFHKHMWNIILVWTTFEPQTYLFVPHFRNIRCSKCYQTSNYFWNQLPNSKSERT